MNSRIRTALSLLGLLGLGLAGCDSDVVFAPPDPDSFVVQAFLFAGEPVTQVTVTEVLPIDADSGAVPEPISDASIRLVRRGVGYPLVPTDGSPGSYHYPGSDLTVEVGDRFELEVEWSDQLATAETVVPPPPTGLELSTDSLAAPSFGQGLGGGFANNRLVVRWSNPDTELHYVVVENVEGDPEPVRDEDAPASFDRRIILPPTPADSSFVSAQSLTHLGEHRVTLYRVNDEYADLYRGLQQDSRDLNEPPSNIVGALGVFSAFASKTASFQLYRAASDGNSPSGDPPTPRTSAPASQDPHTESLTLPSPSQRRGRSPDIPLHDRASRRVWG